MVVCITIDNPKLYLKKTKILISFFFLILDETLEVKIFLFS